MACLIFKLKHVTQEEADEVRQLLADNNIGIYETDTGLFGTSVAGFWLVDDGDEATAKALLDNYAKERLQRVRGEYQRQRQLGQVETFWQRCKTQPLRLGLAVLAIGAILSLSVLPFFYFVF